MPPRRRGRSWRRRLAWLGAATLVLLLLILTPPLINANRYRSRIAESMSKSLGRPVHLDDVSMHLLPVPGFTLRNLVVSEDPAFGAEPTIRANTVEASLRVASLWHRPVEFSTVRFVEPSVNLVRNAEGRWNLSDVLLHASRVQSAPTVQRRAGPTPRFPYIEATGGRVNVKLGAEKLPFALTDADFALWLPSPEGWRVRLEGQPNRTDTNIGDPGRLHVEGELQRAASMDAVPVRFTANWHDAPLGEATRLLTGDDWGWRGTLNLDSTLSGRLGDASFSSKLTLGGLRRGDFFPARPLDLQVVCGSHLAVHPATLTDLRCTLPDDAPEPLVLSAPTVHLQYPKANDIFVEGEGMPLRWALLWGALFSPRVRPDLHPAGTLDISLQHHAVPLGVRAGTPGSATGASRRGSAPGKPVAGSAGALRMTWTGSLHLNLPGASAGETDATLNQLNWQLEPPAAGESWPNLRLSPTTVTLSAGSSLTLSGSLGQGGYSLAANGSAAPAALLTPARYLPELGDGLEAVLPYPPTGEVPERVQISCTRSWRSAQVCTGPGGSTGRPSAAVSGVLPVVPSAEAPETAPTNRLAPRNLSPLERAPFSTPRPSTPLTPQ